jgi:hypothetical protein
MVFGRLRLRLRSVMARRLDDCRGDRVRCFASDEGGTPATTELFRRERGDDFFEARIAAERIPEGVQF